MTSKTDTVLDVEELRVYYQTLKGRVKALDGTSFAIRLGEIIGVAGESGCGKTTFGRSLILRKKPMVHIGGAARLNGEDLMSLPTEEMKKRRFARISIIPQSAMESFSPTRTIRRFIADLVAEHGIKPDARFFDKVRERFRFVNLDVSVLERFPIELSGGMKQRVLMVISTLLNPDLLIADEITSALDVTSQRFVSNLLTQFRDREIVGSIIFITHDLSILYQIADRIIVMYAGQVAEIADADTIIEHPRHPYAKALINSLPRIGVQYREEQLRGIEGVPPKLLEIEEGCRFRFRCPYATDVCGAEDPPEEAVTPADTEEPQDESSGARTAHTIRCHHWREINGEEHI
jgi:peptide/nickel transport system ATP-binding protein